MSIEKANERTGGGDERDELFSILSNQRRRYALHACKCYDTPMDISELSERVAAWEYGKPRSGLDSDERRRVYTSMQQSHLPTMDRAGVIEFDGSEVALEDRAQELEVYMEIIPEGSIPWGKYYLGLTVISAAVLTGVFFGVYPEAIPALAWAALITAGFGGSSVFQYLWTRKMKLGNTDKPPELRD